MSTDLSVETNPNGHTIIQPTQKHTATIIMLHGLGGSGPGLIPSLTDILTHTPGLSHIKFILPTAQSIPITARGDGVPTPGWFDYLSFDFKSETRVEDEEGILRAVALADDFVTREVEDHSIPRHRIVIGGFSNGSVTALMTAISSKQLLAGAFVLGGIVPLRDKTKELMSPHASSLPIFWGHGRVDELVEVQVAQKDAEGLASNLAVPFTAYTGRLGAPDATSNASDAPSIVEAVDVTLAEAVPAETLKKAGLIFVDYADLAHSVNLPELLDLGVWLRAILPEGAGA
ncbi:hypothetical protein DXG01_015739 [Tephrocybe rancida]|nr:hypothetical protein DXG01_015739 [Tephrocybe rancida]